MSDSLFKQLGSVVSTAINTEKTARISADNTEATARQTADSQLQSNINAEATARQTADTTLTNTVTTLQTNLASEVSARQVADNSLTSSVSTLQTELASEVSARQTADTSLTTAINTEVSARQTAITALQGSIDTLNGDNTVAGSVAKTIEDAITAAGGVGGGGGGGASSDALNSEATARVDADALLQASIDTLTTSLDAEATTRQTDVTTLTNAISTESTARQTAVSSLSGTVSALDTAYKAADANEASVRQAADTSLQTAIDSETASRQTAVASLTTTVNSIDTAYKSADSTLTASVAALDLAYKAADTNLSSAISSEVSARQSAVAGVQTAIDTLNAADTVTGSVRKIVGDALAVAPNALDALNQISQQLANNTDAATALTNGLSAETSARQSADATLTTNLNAEVTARQNAITSLTSTVSTLDAAYKAADTTLTTNLNAEVTARQNAITSLTSTVSTLDAAYKAADTALTTSIAGKVTANTAITAGTGTKITYDAKGLVTGSAALAATDIPNLDWAKITTGKPTTLAGYGLTLAASDIPSLNWSKINAGKPITLAGYGITDGQVALVSGTTIKTVNGQSLLGSGDIAISGGSGGMAVTSVGFSYSDFSNTKTINEVAVTGTINLASYFPEVSWGSTNTQTYGHLIQRTDGVTAGVAQFALFQGGYRPTANGGSKATILPFQVNANNTITFGSATTLWTNGSSPNDFSTYSVVTDQKSGSFHYSGNICWPGTTSHTMGYGTAILNANNTASHLYQSGTDNTIGIHDHNGLLFGLPDSDGSGWLGANNGYRQSDSKTMIHGLDFRNPSSPSISVQNPGSDTSTSPAMYMIMQDNSTTSNTAISGCVHWRQSGPRVYARVFAGNSTNYTDICQTVGDWGAPYKSGCFWGVALSTGKVLVYHGNVTNLYTAYNSYSDVTSSAGVNPGFVLIQTDYQFGAAMIVPDGVDSWLVMNSTASVIEKWSINPTTYKWTRKWSVNINAGGTSYMKLNKLPNSRLMISWRSNGGLFYYWIITRASLPA